MINKEFRELTFSVIDTETTGTYGDDRIVEIAGVKILPDFKIDTENVFSELVNPDKKIHYNAYKVHQISNDMVKDKPYIKEILPSFHSFIDNSVLAGHNLPFDLRFIKREYELCGRTFNSPYTLDTLKLSRRFCPELPHHKLDDLMAHFNVSIDLPEYHRHRALFDVYNTALILIEFFKIMEKENIHRICDIWYCIKQ